jgi:hypothetical protein
MSQRAMIALNFTIVAVMSPTFHRSLTITEHGYPLMHYTKVIIEEHFTAGHPLVIVLPIAPIRGSITSSGLK